MKELENDAKINAISKEFTQDLEEARGNFEKYIA